MNNFIIDLGGFALDADHLLFMQEQTETSQKIATVFGQAYIISGVENTNGNISSGWIVYQGEILPFEAGVLAGQVHLIEKTETLTYLEDADNDGQGDLKDAYKYRKVTFDDTLAADEQLVLSFDFSLLKRSNELIAYNLFDAFFRNIPLPYVGPIDQIHPWFKLCDGTNNTPDLTDQFLVTYNPNNADYNAVGNQGGAKDVALTVGQMPQHNHTGNTEVGGNHRHAFQLRNDQYGTGNGEALAESPETDEGYRTYQTEYAGSHSHGFTTNNSGNSQAHENRPPWFTVARIIFRGE